MRLTVLIVVGALAAAGCRQAPLYQPEGFASEQPVAADLASVEAAVLRAATPSKWEIAPVEPGHAVAKRNFKDKHFAEIDIYYDNSGYRLEHKSSVEFNYDGRFAHPTYNRFLENLDDALNYQFRQLAGS